MFGRSRLQLAAILAVTLTVGAASAIGANSATVVSPCKLATRAEVKAAFGGKVAPGRVDNTIPDASTCHYGVTGSNLGMSGMAVVFVTPGQTPATFAIAKKVIPGVVSVKGVGNGAFYNPHTTSVELLKGRVVASAQAIFLNPGGPQVNAVRVKADVIALAKAVAKHL